jgi:hypothetical protein
MHMSARIHMRELKCLCAHVYINGKGVTVLIAVSKK